MFKTLIATCLLTFSSCTGIKQEPKELRVESPRSALNQNGTINVLGGYNFRDIIDFSFLSNFTNYEADYTIYFEYDSRDNLVSYISDGTGQNAFSCGNFRLHSYGTSGGLVIDVEFLVYNGVASTTLTQTFSTDGVLSTSTGNYKDSILGFNTPYTFNGVDAIVFDNLFTSADNQYTYTYNGYYNFTNGITSINQYFSVTGDLSFDTSLYKFLSNRNNGALGGYSTLILLSYNVESPGFVYDSYSLPNGLYSIYTKNIMMNGAKMTNTTYNILSAYGTFSYVRDTTFDDSTFTDMLFGVADTPVYFISRLLNFELFGFNLFIAFTSLLTLCIIIVCIRKFF